jgi:uncharacterized membrane protein (DUF485 family)
MSDNLNHAMTEPGDSAAGDTTDWGAIQRLPEYGELTRARRRLVIPAAVVYLAGYFGFLVLAGTAPAALGRSIHGGLNLGFVLMAGVFVLVWAVAFVYVRVCNSRLDRRAEAVSKKAGELVTASGRDAAP